MCMVHKLDERTHKEEENSRGVAVGGVLGLLDRVEDGEAEVLLAALTRRDPADHVGAVRDGVLAMKGALLPGEALADDLSVAVHPHVGGGGGADAGPRGVPGSGADKGTCGGQHFWTRCVLR